MTIFEEKGLGFLPLSEQLDIVEMLMDNNFENTEEIILNYMIEREFGEGVE